MTLQQQVNDVIEQFEKLKQSSLEEAVVYVSQDETVLKSLRSCLRLQTIPDYFMQPLFEWLYKCAQQGHSSSELFNFVVQFAPDLVLLYLQAVYENQAQLKASAEVLLLAIILESERNKDHSLHVPSLSKPSIYHQSPVQISQSVLTEAALQRHDQSEAPPPRHTFTGKEVTVNNRLLFLSSIIDLFADSLTAISPDSRVSFCDVCIRLAMQGMCDSFIRNLTLDESLNIDTATLSKMKRFSVSDPVIVSLLRGVRMCFGIEVIVISQIEYNIMVIVRDGAEDNNHTILYEELASILQRVFQSCHTIAVQALQALKFRAEYELLTVSMQISHVLCRMLNDLQPVEGQLDPKQHSNYCDGGTSTHMVDPQEIHHSLNSSVLYHNLHSKKSDSLESSEADTQLKAASKVTSV